MSGSTRLNDRPPAVLCVTRAFPPIIGGMERLSAEFTRTLAERTTTIVIANRYGKRLLPVFLPIAAWKLRRLSARADIIHFGDPLLTVLLPVLPKPRKPIVVTAHGLDIVYPNVFYQTLLRHLLRNIDLCLCISRHVEREVRTRFPSVRTLVMSPGMSVEPSAEPPSNTREDLERHLRSRLGTGPLLLHVARLVPRKGTAWFVERVLPNLPGTHLLVIGRGPEEDVIRATAVRAHVVDRLTLAGPSSAEVLQSAYHNADLFVMPNVPIAGSMEGFGLVALEAAAAGLPVVAADLEGIPDAIVPGETGVLVPPRDATAWIRSIRRLLTDPQERARIRASAPRVVRDEFSWSTRADAVLAAFSSLSAGVNN